MKRRSEVVVVLLIAAGVNAFAPSTLTPCSTRFCRSSRPTYQRSKTCSRGPERSLLLAAAEGSGSGGVGGMLQRQITVEIKGGIKVIDGGTSQLSRYGSDCTSYVCACGIYAVRAISDLTAGEFTPQRRPEEALRCRSSRDGRGPAVIALRQLPFL